MESPNDSSPPRDITPYELVEMPDAYRLSSRDCAIAIISPRMHVDALQMDWGSFFSWKKEILKGDY